MKKMFITVISVVMMMFTLSANAAVPALGGAIFGGLVAGLGHINGVDSTKPIESCYYEPLRKVKHKDSQGYSFVVAGCDYQAKKDRLIIVD